MQRPQEPGLPTEQRVALYEVAQVLGARSSLADVFDDVVERLVPHVALDFASLIVLDIEPDMERVVGWYPADAIEHQQIYSRSRARQSLAENYRDGTEWRPPEMRASAAKRMAEGGLVIAWSFPLMDGDEYYGAVTVARRTDQGFTESEQAFLRAAGRLFAAAVREERAIWKAERDAVQAALLTDLMVLLNEGRAPDELFERLVGLLGRAVRFDHASLALVDDEDVLQLATEHPAGRRGRSGRPIVTVEQTGIAEVMQSGGRWLQFDPAGDETELAQSFVRDGFRMVNAVFLQHRGRLVGTIVLSREIPRPFTDDDCDFLALAATLIAQAIVNKEEVERELDATRLEAEEHRLITAVAATAAEEADASTLLERVQSILTPPIPGIQLAFATINGDHSAVVQPSGSPSLITRQALEPPPEGSGPQADTLLDAGYAIAHRSFVRSAGEQEGVLVAATPAATPPLVERQRRILDLAAHFVGASLHTRDTVEHLEQGRALLQLVIATLEDAIVLLDADMRVAFSNSPGQLITRALERLADGPGDPGTLADAIRPAISRRHSASGEVELVVGGRHRTHRYQVTPLHHPIYSFLIVVSDVHDERTRQREREQHQRQMEQAARLSALGELVAGVAHELNNPLTAILGFAELLASADTPPAIHDDLSLIYKEAARARDIVRDLLFLVRPGEVVQNHMTLAGLVGHIERLRASAWDNQHLEVQVDVRDGDVPFTGNEHQLTQVLVNLVSNAEQALSGTPGARLAVRARLDGDAVVIEVEDNGPGMAPDIVGRIWEPFFTTKQGVGTGLGLALSRSIVSNHGGEVNVETEPGRGSLFRITIPRDGARKRPAGIAPRPGQRRILVVDDEPNLRKLARRIIEALGHQCDVAEGVADATELATNNDYDLVLCDYRIATAVADEVLEALVRVAPTLVPRTVIATGATTDLGVEELAGRYGLRVLGKPYGMEEIAGLLNALDRAA